MITLRAHLPRYLPLALNVLGLHVALAAAASPNLLRNGDFEAVFAESGVATSWENGSGWADVDADFRADTARPASGLSAQRIDCPRYHKGSVNFGQSGVLIQSNHSYRIGISLRGDIDSVVELQLRRGKAPYTLYWSRFVRVDDQWRPYEWTALSAHTDPDALFNIRFYAAGSLWVDDASVTVTETPSDVAVLSLTPPEVPVPAAYFGQHSHSPVHLPEKSFGSLRLWDSGVSWPALEPTRGQWDFSRLDDYLKRAEAQGVEVLLPLGLSPRWASARPDEESSYNRNPANQTGWAAEPADLADWRNYVRTVGERYRGRIRHYEIWNEVNQPGFYSGSVPQLVELLKEAYLTLKAIDPANQIVAPSVVGNPGYLEQLYRHGAAEWCDIVGYHYYNFNQPEYFLPVIANIKGLLAATPAAEHPIWNTESGWHIEAFNHQFPYRADKNDQTINLLSSAQAGAYIARAAILYWATGTERSFLYSWDNARMGLREKNGTLKPAAFAYAEIQRWLIGRRMVSCDRNAAGIWTARLESPQGQPAIIVWAPDRDTSWTVPADFSGGTLTRLDGTVTAAIGPTLDVSYVPVRISPAP